MTFTQVLSAAWSMFFYFFNGSAHVMKSYSNVAETVEHRSDIWKTQQFHELQELQLQFEQKQKAISKK